MKYKKQIKRDDYLLYICTLITEKERWIYDRYMKIITFLDDCLNNLTKTKGIQKEIEMIKKRFEEKHKTRFRSYETKT